MDLSLAMVALGPKPQLSVGGIHRDLKATWPTLPAAGGAKKEDNTLSFDIGDAWVALGLMPAPIPWSDLERPCVTSWLWPEAAQALRGHKNHLVVTLSSAGDPLVRAQLLSAVIASILATCPQALGVYWGTGGLVISPKLFREFAVQMLPDGLPLYMWIDFRVFPNDRGKMSGFTQGLAALGHMELETQNSPEAMGELRERFFGLACYVLTNGPVIRDGDTVGENANEKIRVSYSPSAFGHKGQVMRLDYSQATKPWWKMW